MSRLARWLSYHLPAISSSTVCKIQTKTSNYLHHYMVNLFLKNWNPSFDKENIYIFYFSRGERKCDKLPEEMFRVKLAFIKCKNVTSGSGSVSSWSSSELAEEDIWSWICFFWNIKIDCWRPLLRSETVNINQWCHFSNRNMALWHSLSWWGRKKKL